MLFAGHFGQNGRADFRIGENGNWIQRMIIVFLVEGSGVFCGKMAKFALEFKKFPVLI